MAKNDGGPAFPVEMDWQDGKPRAGKQTTSFSGWETGMTLRDYYAGQVVGVLLRNYFEGSLRVGPTTPIGQLPETIGRESYEIADAMLKAREQ
jgi:hypothetical protein